MATEQENNIETPSTQDTPAQERPESFFVKYRTPIAIAAILGGMLLFFVVAMAGMLFIATGWKGF